MEQPNHTIQTEFLLLGLSDHGPWQVVLFLGCLCIYVSSLVGNLILITLVMVDSHLHTPMYFFLSNFSFLEICFTSVTVPRLLANTLAGRKVISLPGCVLQAYFLHSMGCTECFFLAVMAFDRYVAIHRPLRYTSIMSRHICVALAATTWLGCHLYSSIHSVLLSRLSFCGGTRETHHYFCDIPPLLQAACSDTSLNKAVLNAAGTMLVVCPFAWTFLSYILIFSAVLQIDSAQGRAKAFSTCASHLTMVLLFYGTVIFMYIRPEHSCCSELDRTVSMLYTALTPMLNPIIYSLRNKQVKGALRRVLNTQTPCQRTCPNLVASVLPTNPT